MNRNRSGSRRAFTLLELCIVMATFVFAVGIVTLSVRLITAGHQATIRHANIQTTVHAFAGQLRRDAHRSHDASIVEGPAMQLHFDTPDARIRFTFHADRIEREITLPEGSRHESWTLRPRLAESPNVSIADRIITVTLPLENEESSILATLPATVERQP